MSKTRYQEDATDYAQDYLDRLLRMEATVGRSIRNKREKEKSV